MSGGHLIVLMVVLTSLGAVAIGVRLLCLPARALLRAGAAVVDVLGLAVLFFVANAALGVLVLLAERHLGGRLVSLHTIDDVALYAVSTLQAIAFQTWRTAGRDGRSRTDPPAAPRLSRGTPRVPPSRDR